MYLFKDFPGKANYLLYTGEILVKSLTYNGIDLYSLSLKSGDISVLNAIVKPPDSGRDAYPSGAVCGPRVCTYTHSLASYWAVLDGIEHLISSSVPNVLPLVPF
ncbi:hypothetical protein DSO57_1014246 [Entomophthora muscae]|uniref:Uncharacterized protein n=1 Tax=Entomophthora muscae TaxID=34485 RepID=A0ACC2UEV0_9FUNG|nr:hypothetical protein DSO57_1014246 [Entomophthora muscae]